MIEDRETLYFSGNSFQNILHPIIKQISNSFTYECWVKPTNPIAIAPEASTGISGTSGQRYVIGPACPENENHAATGLSIGTNGICIFEHGPYYLPALLVYPITITDWTHIAVVYINKVPHLYVNGEFKKKGLPSSKEYIYMSGIIGGISYGFYKGYIKDLTIWNYPRNIDEIRRNMHKEAKDGQNGLFGHWNFNNKSLVTSHNINVNIDSLKDISVLFVKADFKDALYAPIENSMISNLKKLVKRVDIALSKQNLAHICRRIKPDLVLVFHGFETPVQQIQAINTMGIPTALWLTDDPYYTDITDKLAPHYTFVLTQEVNCVSFYQSLGCKQVYHVPLGADMDIFHPKEVQEHYKTDILFLGSAFWNRVHFFDKIAPYLASKNTLISGLWWNRLSNYSLLKDKIRLNHWMTNEETCNYYNGAKIVLNMYRSYDDQTMNENSKQIQAFSLNPRTFEVSACAAFQLTNTRPDLDVFYKVGYNIITYDTPESLIEKIEYYLNHEEERRTIGLRALENIKKEHSYEKRLSQILKIIFPHKW